MGGKVLLIGFYFEKLLSVRYLSRALEINGYDPYIIFFKKYYRFENRKASEAELKLLEDLIDEIQPDYVGLSVMSSLYMETVSLVNDRIKGSFDIPVIWGGVYPTLFPEEALKHADYLIRGEGERSLVELLDALGKGKDLSSVKNLVMRDENSDLVMNPLYPLVENLDELAYPRVKSKDVFFIRDNELIREDPHFNAFSYEMIASRGCPFSCSYCSVNKLRELYRGKGKFVRKRSVDHVVEEIKSAKQTVPNLRHVIFWDEIFPDEISWIEEFKEKYKKEVGLPFRIWGHPLRINRKSLEGLVEAGLYELEVGIQSGSYRIRKEIFNRSETQEDILRASRIISETKVPRVVYDFMTQHPFETLEDLKEEFNLFSEMKPPFELQIHGLTFLPGTDIVDKAMEEGILTPEELQKITSGSLEEQYYMYWRGAVVNQYRESRIWVSLIYMTQFPFLRPAVKKLALEVEKGRKEEVVLTLKKLMKQVARMRNLISDGKMFMQSSGDSAINLFSFRGFNNVLLQLPNKIREAVSESEDQLYKATGGKKANR